VSKLIFFKVEKKRKIKKPKRLLDLSLFAYGYFDSIQIDDVITFTVDLPIVDLFTIFLILPKIDVIIYDNSIFDIYEKMNKDQKMDFGKKKFINIKNYESRKYQYDKIFKKINASKKNELSQIIKKIKKIK
jgi:hypothetical protein